MTGFYAYLSNGVSVNSADLTAHDTFVITYNGLLVKNGATAIYSRVGFGNGWDHARDYQMSRTNQGFEASIALPRGTYTLKICFRDAAGNWDNNSGANYSYDFQPN
ncbi:MAG: carbohydrate-binding protein [Negativicutes bacterium]|nr:carbohydrate-binding protein [Negativicutes bacterium]